MCKLPLFGLFLVLFQVTIAQVPPRLQIPGAVLVQGARPSPLRQQRINALNTEFVPRQRRPPPPLRDIRPVVEEEEENYPSSPAPSISSFDAEVNKLSIPAITSAVRQAEDEDFQQPFKQERPVPITKDQIREKPTSDFPSSRPRPAPVFRQEPRPSLRPSRPIVRQDLNDEEENIPRAPRPKLRPQPVQQQQFRAAPRPKQPLDDEERTRKQPVQILRKYRTDNEDGSITWGFENEDGTFKEETLGIDCVISGKYGYVDPDGVKREFSYEAGNKCDPNQLDEDELEEELARKNAVAAKRPNSSGNPKQAQPQAQYRPQLAQY